MGGQKRRRRSPAETAQRLQRRGGAYRYYRKAVIEIMKKVTY
jgi:hypothetical protein